MINLGLLARALAAISSVSAPVCLLLSASAPAVRLSKKLFASGSTLVSGQTAKQLAKTRALGKREFHQLVRTNNQSGVPGVQFIQPRRQPQGSWQARLKLPGGKELTRTFSVKRYGYEGAFKRAVRARQELLETIEDKPYLMHPTAKRYEARRVGAITSEK